MKDLRDFAISWHMDLAALPSIIMAIAEQNSLETLLTEVVNFVASQPDVALVRLWLYQSDQDCPRCTAINHQPSPPALHLRASAGISQDAAEDWSKTEGNQHRTGIDRNSKASRIAATGESIRIQRLSDDLQMDLDPAWIQREGLAGFAGHPLVFRGEVLGVLAVYRRTEPNDHCWTWLRVVADSAAVAIANARALAEVESLRHALELERDYLRDELQEAGSFGEIVGSSPALEQVLRQVEMVAPTDANVLILGESGTGKELIARAIHQRSHRSHKPLVKVNCGSVPRELFESEFFGHARGSFTGAIRDRVGRFQLADGGTLFLDEVGEIPLELQTKLLRVLQEGEFERVGDDRTRKVNVRLVAATNRDLRNAVAEGRFRLDLYYRLAVFPLQVPSLRERREDIAALAAHFIGQACERFHVPPRVLKQRELERALQYDWPGNVRELQNVIERAVIASRGGALILDLPNSADLPRRMETNLTLVPSRIEPGEVIPEHEWRRLERANVLAALKRSRSRVSGKGGAAELLGVNSATLASRLKALGINRHEL